jgi:LysR family transcriptional regulator, hydrogen peroxide-inducible genes activator
MTITQLQYIVAVDTYKSFGVAAEKCSVTQPTLSMQIQKLEEEVGIKIFDRSKQPVIATEVGREIINQARIVLNEFELIKVLVESSKNMYKGELRVGIIPTLAPYILPLFIVDFLKKFPNIHLKVSEHPTEEIIFKLKNGILDCGLLATPLDEPGILETPLFYENFVAYGSEGSSVSKKTELDIEDIDLEEVWLLDEGNCMRSQVMSLCKAKSKIKGKANFHYQTGSIETLKRMVQVNNGVTILPELAINTFTEDEIERIRFFKSPEPVREISMVTHRHIAKKNLIDLLNQAIIKSVPEKMRIKESKRILNVDLKK